MFLIGLILTETVSYEALIVYALGLGTAAAFTMPVRDAALPAIAAASALIFRTRPPSQRDCNLAGRSPGF